jgi:uncharacterized SAM-binding protein YcdF (DUF218 family)
MAVVGVGLALVVALIAVREPLLAGMGRWLVVESELQSPAGLVVALGGDRTRELVAASLLRRGVAERILFSGADVRAEDYACRGVPPDRALPPLTEATTTYEEAQAVRKVMQARGLRSAIIVTSSHHLRRARWSFERVFRGTGISLGFSSAPYEAFPIGQWWKSHIGRKLVLTEYLGLAYYWLTVWG